MKYKSRETAIENIKKFFTNTTNSDVITLEDAFRGWGRPNPENVEANKPWLSNELTHLRYHNLIKTIYSISNGKRKMVKLQLTLEGKKALGRIGDQPTISEVLPVSNSSGYSVSLDDVAKIVASFKKQHEEYEVTFDVRLKNDKG